MPFDASPQACKTRCTVCPAAPRCLIRGAERVAIERWSSAIEGQPSLGAAGKILFEAGTAADALYIVRAGCLKSFTFDEEGNERVRGFHLPGDIIGLDSVGSITRPATVAAVAPSQVCRILMPEVRRILADSPALAQRLLERAGHELSHALTLAGDYTAEQRLAAFLLSMEQRLGASPRGLRLPMTRRDIANYLRLATETVCRVLTRFEQQGQVRSNHKVLELLNMRALRALAQPVGGVLARAA